MRTEGVTYARVGELELRLAPPIAPLPTAPADEPPDSPAERERRDLETLLASSGADVTPFLGKRFV